MKTLVERAQLLLLPPKVKSAISYMRRADLRPRLRVSMAGRINGLGLRSLLLVSYKTGHITWRRRLRIRTITSESGQVYRCDRPGRV